MKGSVMVCGLVLLTSVAAFAQGPPIPAGSDIALYGGSVYVVHAGLVARLNRNLDVISAVELAAGRAIPLEAALAEEAAAAGAEVAPEEAPAQEGELEQAEPQDPLEVLSLAGSGELAVPPPGAIRMIDTGAAIEADDMGVYVMLFGEVALYDHDLQLLGSRQIIEPQDLLVETMVPEWIERPQTLVGAGYPTPSPGALEGAFSAPATQPVRHGQVVMQHWPAVLTPGTVVFRVGVLDMRGRLDRRADVRAYLYSVDDPDHGETVRLEPEFGSAGGYLYDDAYLSHPGQWELAIRLTGSGRERDVVYFGLPVR